MKKIDLARLVPPGVSANPLLTNFLCIVATCTLCSFSFFGDLNLYLSHIYVVADGQRIWTPGAMLEYYYVIVQGHFTVFWVLFLAVAAYIPAYYVTHFQSSKSIYTMRRIPSRWELHRRCWSLPVLLIIAGCLTVGLLYLLYFAIYMISAPAEHIRPNQWEMIWRNLL